MFLHEIENRFKEIANIKNYDLSIFPLTKDSCLQVTTDKQKSNMFGEVFTPLWLVDNMILSLTECREETTKKLYSAKSPLDLCAGYGQFTLRMLRCIYNYTQQHNKDFNVSKWLKKHSFSELQFESVYKLLYIFGAGTNIYIGNSIYLNTLTDKDNGILIHNGKKWINITKEIRKKFSNIKRYDVTEEAEFSGRLKEIINKENSEQTKLF